MFNPRELEEATRWLDGQAAGPRQPRRCGSIRWTTAVHLVIGDSIGRDSGLASRMKNDVVLNRCRGGATAQSIFAGLELDLRHWEMSATAHQLPRGWAVYWVSANNVYSRFTGGSNLDPGLMSTCSLNVQRTVEMLLTRTQRILVLGPLPRLDGDLAGLAWEKTAAFHLERAAKRAVEAVAANHTEARIQFVPLGRCLTKKQGGRHCVRPECAGWFRGDLVHLSLSGYEKLADAQHLPIWVRLGGSR